MNLLIFLFFLLAALNVGHIDSRVRHFQRANRSIVPKSLLESKYLCGDTWDSGETIEACEKDFDRIGKVWTGDINDDGVKQLVVYPGLAWSGSGGDSYFLFQKRGKRWISLSVGINEWFTPNPRFDILPTVHNGYHDLRIARDWCVKWDGKEYVDYDDADYHHLSPKFFDSSEWTEAAIFWAIRYKGLKDFQFTPQWFSSFKNDSSKNVVLGDARYRLQWIAFFKGGIWGVDGSRAFLLLPRPSYRGSEQMEFDGDWLVIHGEKDDPSKSAPVVARFNRRTNELVILPSTAQ